MKKINKLNIQGSLYSQYKYFRGHNYTEGGALAEFIDNSTASYFNHIDELNKIKIDINYDDFTKTLTIYDNAYGMNEENFHRALIFGSEPDVHGRNEYGYGLKVAATWFGERWSVESSELGSKNKYYGCIDLDELKNNTSNEISIETTECDEKEHYTLIKIEKVDKTIATRKIRKTLIEFLEKKYRRDIKNGNIEIVIDSEILKFEDYEPLIYKDEVYKKNILIEFNHDGKDYKVDGFVGILKKGGFTKTGFALFHNDRTIIEAYKPKEIYVQERSQVDRTLYGELNMDSFEVTQQKNAIKWNASLKEKFIKLLKTEIKDYISVAGIAKKELEVKEKEYQETKNKKDTQPENNLPEETDKTSSDNIITDVVIVSNGNNEDVATNNPFENVNDDNVNSETVISDNTNVNDGESHDVKESKKNIINRINMDKVTYEIDYVNNKSGLYKLINNINRLEIDLEHPFIKKYDHEIPEDIIKLLLCLAIAEKEAIVAANDDGYISPTIIKNKLNELLKK